MVILLYIAVVGLLQDCIYALLHLSIGVAVGVVLVVVMPIAEEQSLAWHLPVKALKFRFAPRFGI